MGEADIEYNKRQYRLILRKIDDYGRGAIKLGELVGDLDALRLALQNPSDHWLREFESAWGKLEDVFAVMLDESRSEFDAIDTELISNALRDIRLLVDSKLAV